MCRSPMVCGALWIACLGGMLGCGSPSATPADPERARATLAAALETWKSGESFDVLPKRSPPIYFRDPDWVEGWKLKGFRTTLDDEEHGQQRRCYVHLTLESPKGQAAAKEVQYLVDTSPALVIVRIDD